jgi:hypothetical protein
VNAAVLVAAAGEVDQTPGRWSLQPSLVLFLLVVALLAGFYLGRVSDDVHRWWLDLWGTIAFWVGRGLIAAGAIAVAWLLFTWWQKSRGAG